MEEKNVTSYKEGALDMQLAGCLYFNHITKQAVAEKWNYLIKLQKLIFKRNH